MDRSLRRRGYLLVVLILVAVAVFPATGCRSLLTTVVYLVKGTNIDADYDGLKEKTVVVVCRPMASLEYRDAQVAKDLARQVGALLRANVSKINVINQNKVSEWTDVNDWTDFAEVGKGLDADMVVGIELLGFKLRQGQTLYQGKADTIVKVVDCNDGDKIVFQRKLDQLLYPPNTGIETSTMGDAEFRRKLILVLADQVARHFYPHDPHADFAMDATVLD